MTNKKNDEPVETLAWRFALPTQEELEQESLNKFQLARNRQRVLTQAEQRVVNEAHKQLLVTKYDAIKGQAVAKSLTELTQLAARCVSETAVHHGSLTKAAAGTAYGAFVDQFNRTSLQSLGRHQLKIDELYYDKLVDESLRTIYVKDEPEVIIKEVPVEKIVELPRKRFWER